MGLWGSSFRVVELDSVVGCGTGLGAGIARDSSCAVFVVGILLAVAVCSFGGMVVGWWRSSMFSRAHSDDSGCGIVDLRAFDMGDDIRASAGVESQMNESEKKLRSCE